VVAQDWNQRSPGAHSSALAGHSARRLARGEEPEDGTVRRIRTPEQHASRRELGRLLETAIDRLPDEYRQVFVLRIVDSLDSAETAEVLELNQATIRQRLHRARGMLRADINRQAGTALETTFNYPGPQCDGMVARVMRRIAPDGTEYRN